MNTRSDESNQPAPEYGFGGRLAEGFPSQFVIDSTEVCNLACIHCPHPEFKKSEYYDARYLDPELNMKLVEEVRDHGGGSTQYLRYASNGEPLIHPKGYEMIEYAVRNSGVFVTLTTNGTIMNEKRTLSLLEAGVHMIDISLDAHTAETYAKVRVNGDLNVTRANVLRLIDWIDSTGSETKVVVSFVEQPANSHETETFRSYWNDNGADFVVVRKLHSASGSVIPIADFMRKQNESIKRRPCVYPWERMVLNARGCLAFCPADWSHGSTVIDYRTTTIKETWHGEFYAGLRKAHLDSDFSGHGFCGQCPDWVATRWPHEGRAYADLIEDFTGA